MYHHHMSFLSDNLPFLQDPAGLTVNLQDSHRNAPNSMHNYMGVQQLSHPRENSKMHDSPMQTPNIQAVPPLFSEDDGTSDFQNLKEFPSNLESQLPPGMYSNPVGYNNTLFSSSESILPTSHTTPTENSPWNAPLKGMEELPRNKNLGKVAIKSDRNLSSSTEDLLSLVGKTHLTSPPNDVVVGMNDLSLSSSQPILNGNSKPQIPKIDIDSIQHPQNKALSKSGPSICRYYTQGHCGKGSKCSYVHAGDLRHNESVTNLKNSRRGKRSPLSSPSKYSNMTIDDCLGNIFLMCKDQHGCRFLQKRLDEDKSPRTCRIIFSEVLEGMSELMSDPFGNYLCQKLIEKCTIEQRTDIVRSVSPNLVLISKNMHGTRAVQKTIDQISTPEEIKMVCESLKGNVVSLIQDLNGNHVIQKCIHKMEPNDNQFIYDAVAQHCVQVATHRHGCCVMQRCIDHASDQQRMQLIEEIKNNSLELVQDAFGNYVVQYILDLGYESVCEQLAEKLVGSLGFLSTQKFSSNVVEKCLKVGNARTVEMMARKLSELTMEENELFLSSDEDPLIQLLQHPFGNYVVQTALQMSATKAVAEWNSLAERIRPHIHNLKSTPYVKRIQALLNHGPVNMEK